VRRYKTARHPDCGRDTMCVACHECGPCIVHEKTQVEEIRERETVAAIVTYLRAQRRKQRKAWPVSMGEIYTEIADDIEARFGRKGAT